MSTAPDTTTANRRHGSRQSRAIRLLLWLLATASGIVGTYAVAAPHSFYRHVIGVHLLGPYNEHLMRDVGGLYLGFALTFTLAARTLVRELAVASCAGFALAQAAHFLYHALHLEPFPLEEGAAQTIGLAALLALPLVVLCLSRDPTYCSPGNQRSRKTAGASPISTLSSSKAEVPVMPGTHQSYAKSQNA
jgi:hypothetical protein